MYLCRTKLIVPNSTSTTTIATVIANRKSLIKKGSVCPIPPAVVINPVAVPRILNRPVLLPFPSFPHAGELLPRQRAAPATMAAVSETPLRPRGEAAECGRRTVRETLRTAGPGVLLPPRASLRTSVPSPDTIRATGPQIRRKSVHLLLRSESPAPGFHARSNP